MPTARMSKRSKIVAASAALALATTGGVVAMMGNGQAATTPTAGATVDKDLVNHMTQAANSCPALSAAKLAGQIMATSGFDATRLANTGEGIAGFSDAAWKVWAPSPEAQRTDSRASIYGLAHYMCDMIGKVRVAGVTGDQWRLGLAAVHSGIPEVKKANGVPAVAQPYVARVANYAAWYALQPDFGGPGDLPAPPAAPATLNPPSAADAITVPSDLVAPIVVAGTICKAVTPARIAAQLMAMSRFNRNLVTDRAEGIAQFQPDLWSRYAPSASASRKDPKVAIPALGRAMCDLTDQLSGISGDPYVLALAAYQWRSDLVIASGGVPGATAVETFIVKVLVYAEHYANDNRLTKTSTIPSPAASSPDDQPNAEQFTESQNGPSGKQGLG